jgi:hypothetical protein
MQWKSPAATGPALDQTVGNTDSRDDNGFAQTTAAKQGPPLVLPLRLLLSVRILFYPCESVFIRASRRLGPDWRPPRKKTSGALRDQPNARRSCLCPSDSRATAEIPRRSRLSILVSANVFAYFLPFFFTAFFTAFLAFFFAGIVHLLPALTQKESRSDLV